MFSDSHCLFVCHALMSRCVTCHIASLCYTFMMCYVVECFGGFFVLASLVSCCVTSAYGVMNVLILMFCIL